MILLKFSKIFTIGTKICNYQEKLAILLYFIAFNFKHIVLNFQKSKY